MKKVFVIALFTGLAMNLSCSKENQDEGEIISKWELIEELYDPGDGSGVFEEVDYFESVEFLSDSKVNISTSWCYGATVKTVSYDETAKTIYLDCQQDVTWSYELRDDNLFLYPNCVESCVKKYKSLK
jgi:hypothetical protein